MPAFDPVRDAVLNSPITPSPSLPRQPSTPSPALAADPDASPVLPRRATDLSVLLNNSPPRPVRSSSLAHLLLPTKPPSPPPDDRLGRAPPLQRLAPSSVSLEASRFAFGQLRQPTTPSSPEALFTPVNERSAGLFTPSIEHRGPILPPTSPLGVRSRPSTSSSTSHRPSTSSSHRPPPSPSMPPPRTPRLPTPPPAEPATLPYNPRRRTPAGSVLVPLTPDEVQMYRTQLGTGAQRLAKRKRTPSAERELASDFGEDGPRMKRSRDVSTVVQHYNARPEVGVDQRRDSPIIGLRNFNNWIKSVLISKFAHPALQASPSGGQRGNGGRGKVLDMGCGKGGDLNKWNKARIKEYVGVDIAAVSIEQARIRWESLNRSARFFASFAALDCYAETLTRGIPPARLAPPFDVVSMQFCMHYAFESLTKARCMLENATRWLRKGGVLVGTIPNAEQLLDRLDGIDPDASELSYGNSVYKIRFDDRTNRPIYGHRYSFFLRDAVEDVPEYVVRWDNFVQLAEEYGLYPVYKKEFHEVFVEFQDHPEFKQLLQRMKVVDEDGATEMDEDQWEAANIYIAFAMEKRR